MGDSTVIEARKFRLIYENWIDQVVSLTVVKKGRMIGVMKSGPKALGQFIVADPRVCRGRPTFKGTRVTVADVLADVEQGLSWDFIAYRWGDGRIDRAAIAEAVQLARRALLTREGQLIDDAAAA
jgi:uncharacterized protein (DUF433 family)